MRIVVITEPKRNIFFLLFFQLLRQSVDCVRVLRCRKNPTQSETTICASPFMKFSYARWERERARFSHLTAQLSAERVIHCLKDLRRLDLRIRSHPRNRSPERLAMSFRSTRRVLPWHRSSPWGQMTSLYNACIPLVSLTCDHQHDPFSIWIPRFNTKCFCTFHYLAS